MSKPAEIKHIAGGALACFDNTMNVLGLAGGRKQGREYQPLNPNRSDGSVGSFSINQDTGAWSDFATGDKGGDLVALAGYVWSMTQGKAAEKLAEILGLSISPQKTNSGASQKQTSNSSPSTTQYKPAVQNANKEDSSLKDGYKCIMPLPNDAPAPFATHSRHGTPSVRHVYMASDGRVNFYHDRFEPKKPGDKKQFAPLTLWESVEGQLEWRFKAPPAPRPLYGLNRLNELPDAVVWIVEGEKAADAIASIAPDLVVVCWQGGSQAVDKSDFNPLRGRKCCIWPDNDAAGSKAAGDLVKSIKVAGVASLKILNISALVAAAKIYGYEIQPGDDAADLINHGFDRNGINKLIASDGVLVSIDLKENLSGTESKLATFKRHFQVNDGGVWVVDVNRDRDAYQAPKRICERLDVLAHSRSPANGEWGLLVAFNDRDHVLHRFVIPSRSFNGEGLEATGLLYENGLAIETKGRQLVLEYLQQQNPDKRASVTNRLGWHGESENAVFVLPHGAIGKVDEEWIFDSAQPNASPFKQRGTLAGWRQKVASLCTGNSRLMFAVSIFFAAPLRYLLDIKDLGGFHYRGASSDGKSTALRMAASVCGGSDYMQRWRATDNGLESLAMQHCDAPLFLDELKMMDPKAAGEAAYMLANGSGKARANEKGGARKTAQWRLIFLSAGEIGLSQHMLDANKRVHAGQEIRMADIPADAGAGFGCYENLHGHANGNAFAKAIAGAMSQEYGTAFPIFLEAVIKDRLDLPTKLVAAQNAFDKNVLSETASGQARRVAGIFALVGAAGELATRAGITGWVQGEAFKAAETCFKAWLQGFGGEGNQEERAMLSQVRLFLEQNGEGAFADINRSAIEDNHAARVTTKAGYRKLDAVNNTLEYYVYPEVFRNVMCKGLDYNAVVKLLISKGYMHKGDGRHAGHPKRTLPEGSKRVYHIMDTIFTDEND